MFNSAYVVAGSHNSITINSDNPYGMTKEDTDKKYTWDQVMKSITYVSRSDRRNKEKESFNKNKNAGKRPYNATSMIQKAIYEAENPPIEEVKLEKKGKK